MGHPNHQGIDNFNFAGLFPGSTLTARSQNASKLSKKVVGQSVLSAERALDGTSMAESRLLVSIVDDDESVRESLPDLLGELGFAARAFSSADDFLKSDSVLLTRCLILDIAMPGMSGLELQRKLKRRRIEMPIIFITAHPDEAVRRSTIEQGAVECLPKPFTDTTLLNALNAALRVK